MTLDWAAADCIVDTCVAINTKLKTDKNYATSLVIIIIVIIGHVFESRGPPPTQIAHDV